MRLKRSVSLVFFALLAFTFSCSSADVNPTSPANLLTAFSSAVSAGNEAKAETLCTKEFWKAKRNSGKRFFKQAVRKKFELKKSDVQLKGKRAVVTADIIRNGKVVDQVFFYAVDVNSQWLFDGMDENKNHVDYYMNGDLPARFYLPDYSGSKELEELGAKLINIAGPLREASSDPAKQESLLKGTLVGNPGNIYSELRLLLKVATMKLKIVSTHMVDPIRRGAIVIHDETGKEKVFIYVAKEAGGWKLVNCHTGWLSAESILR